MKQAVALIATLLLTVNPVFATTMLPTLLQGLQSANPALIQRHASLLSLSFSPEGQMLYARRNAATGKYEVETLEEARARQVARFLNRLDPAAPETGMAEALIAYLRPDKPEDLADSPFLSKDAQGRWILSARGKNALLDILTADDGQLLGRRPPQPRRQGPAVTTAQRDRDGNPQAGTLAAVRSGRTAADQPAAAFDGGALLGDYDWEALDGAVEQPGGLNSVAARERLDGYSYNEGDNTVRVIVAGPASAGNRRSVVGADAAQEEALAAAGLDVEMFRRHGAKVVSSVDINGVGLTTIDVPAPDAAKLGLALRKQGIASRPARRFLASQNQAARALTAGAGAAPGFNLLPLPIGRFAPSLVRANRTIDTGGLHGQGMYGAGATIGVIDSGIYEEHPDFLDAQGNSRIVAYEDFTGEDDKRDVVGHGTHVSGMAAGSGKASDGRHVGAAPQAELKIARVFGSTGETDESVILQAMLWMGQGIGVDVLNMSLGGPGVPNRDPLSAMTNYLAAQKNMAVVVAAGNEGPFPGSVGSPGNAKYGFTVGSVDQDGRLAFYSSRGTDGDDYTKVDFMAVGGGVDFSAIESQMVSTDGAAPAGERPGGLALLNIPEAPNGRCVYSPGVISARSPDDADTACAVAGNSDYRYSSGTSMATPSAAGQMADVIAYVRGATGDRPDVFEVKAVFQEHARDLGVSRESQGAGLINGGDVARAVVDRVKRGIPIGNIAYSLALRLTSSDNKRLEDQTRYEMTPLGIFDNETGRLIRNEREMERVLEDLRSRESAPLMMVRREETATAA